MPIGLQRFQQSGQFHFITFSCYRRQPLLSSPQAKDMLEQILEHTRAQQGLLIAAYVLMPEHVHLLTDEPRIATIATFLQILKQRSSRVLKVPETEQFWQRRYYDRNVSTHTEALEKVEYIHRNPVKRGLVSAPEDYPWSSFLHCATGEPGRVTLESEWTARYRGKAG